MVMLRRRSAPLWIDLWSMTVVLAMTVPFLADLEGQRADPAVAPYVRVPGWPQPPPAQNGGPGFGNLTGIAVDAQGLVYAARRCPGKCGDLTDGTGARWAASSCGIRAASSSASGRTCTRHVKFNKDGKS
jgi:hypothetical protein